jgi:N-acetylglucosaminyldiphosphoundecaprenol N-acetyl-beta-D-mannosaminyltransferase
LISFKFSANLTGCKKVTTGNGLSHSDSGSAWGITQPLIVSQNQSHDIAPPVMLENFATTEPKLFEKDSQAGDIKKVSDSASRVASGPSVNLPKLDVSRVWGVPFSLVDMPQCVHFLDQWISRGQPGFVVTANLHYVMLHHQQEGIAEVTQQATMILADGMPIVWRSRLSSTPLPSRVTGADLIYKLAELAAQKSYRVFLFGAAEGVAAAAAEKLVEKYPGLQIAGCYSPPFRQLSEAETAEMLQGIKDTKPDIILVALGQPKGEFWVLNHYLKLQAPLTIQVGASFDFVAGRVRRAPVFFQRTGLEWLYRALSEPKRLVPRYARNMRFMFRMIMKDVIALWQR